MGSFDVNVIVRNLPYLWEGLQLSFLLAALAIAGGIFFGAILAVLRMSSIRPVAWFAVGYVNFFRSVPLILVIFWFYFLVPLLLGRATGPFLSAVIAFTLFETAYYCEIIRAGLQSIPKGQINAGRASGMTRIQAMRYIVMPQAFRNMTPILLTQSIILFQDTSLAYVVTLRDFMTSVSTVANQELRLVELYAFAAVVYLGIRFTGSRLVNRDGTTSGDDRHPRRQQVVRLGAGSRSPGWLTVARGEVIVVCGPSGSGKSTLIRCVNGLEPFDQGEIVVGLRGRSRRDLPAPPRRLCTRTSAAGAH